ncbi:methyltransferase domain-containing protein [Saccharothrix sp. BKS2]|uniref:methyltransferase domain-containing protein n=1 Tax=Saccharothrix sp. BKS2 TaxID=3064400 RepID=UPI0039ED0AFE
MDLAAELRDRMVDSLTASGVLRDPRWEAAFREVPRHVFLPGFFVQRPDGAWSAVTADHPDHLALVYRNQVCVTQLNGDDRAWEQALAGRPAVGVPTSSSSMPAIMAIMLQALDVAGGSRVLEIGTGTGYNAALLSHVAGAGNITSIDVDPGVLARASAHLSATGHHPECVLGDGELGHPPGAPYDRVLGTCAVSRIPPAWLAQTAPGGLVVTTFNRAIGAGLVRLTVRDGVATGPVLVEDGRFMPLRAHHAAWANEALGNALDAEPTSARGTLLGAEVVLDPAHGFEFFAGLALPGVVVAGDPPRLAHRDGSWVRHLGSSIAQGGPRRLWDDVEAAYARWRELGRPRRRHFTFTATPADQYFSLPRTPHTWRL